MKAAPFLFGAGSLPIELLPLLERFEKIYLWMDDDLPGQSGAEKFARKLGVGRCLLIRSRNGSTEGPKDANDALRSGYDLEELIRSAQHVPHKNITSFDDIRFEIELELSQGSALNGVPIQSLPLFSKLLKGIRPGELTIVTGPTGIGKTTVMSQISMDICSQGMRTLWGSFEIKNHRLARMMMNQLSQKEIDMGNFEKCAEEFSPLPMYFLKFHGSTELEAVLDAMEYAVYVYDVGHILLDNLQFMITHSSTRNRFDSQDDAVSAFRKFATNHNVHITLAVHPRKESDTALLGLHSVFGSAKVTQEADNVLLLQALDKGRRLRTLNLQKNRYDGETGHIPYSFNRTSRRIEEMTNEDFQKKSEEIGIRRSDDISSERKSPRAQEKPSPLDQMDLNEIIVG